MKIKTHDSESKKKHQYMTIELFTHSTIQKFADAVTKSYHVNTDLVPMYGGNNHHHS